MCDIELGSGSKLGLRVMVRQIKTYGGKDDIIQSIGSFLFVEEPGDVKRDAFSILTTTNIIFRAAI